MEVVTTNNHSQSHHHHHHLNNNHHRLPTTHHSSNIGGSNVRSPFQREVREWQRIDPQTGALMTGRLEADRWVNGPMNSYGKISDSQNISQPNGTQHTQRKQIEVLQACTSNGAMQVIRAQTTQKTSSRSPLAWSSSSTSLAVAAAGAADLFSSVSPSSLLSPTVNGDGAHYNSLFHKHPLHKHHHHQYQHHHHLHPRPELHSSPSPINLLDTTSTPMFTLDPDYDDYHRHNDVGDNDFTRKQIDNDSVESEKIAIVEPAVRITNTTSNNINNDDVDDVSAANTSDDESDQNNDQTLNQQPYKFKNSQSNNLMLLLDTAPSLKLSNLMKSSSSASSNNSSNSTTTLASPSTTSATASAAASAVMNTHKRAEGKISLCAIVGNNRDISKQSEPSSTLATALPSSPTSPTSSARSARSAIIASTTSWQRQKQQQQLFEQPSLYGSSSSSSSKGSSGTLNKSRVGVADSDEAVGKRYCGGARGGGGGGGVGDDDSRSGGKGVAFTSTSGSFTMDDQHHHYRRQAEKSRDLTPTQLKRQSPRRDLESFRHYNNTGDDDDDDDGDGGGGGDHTFSSSSLLSAKHKHTRSSDGYNNGNDDDNSRSTSSDHHNHRRRRSFNDSSSLQRVRSVSTDDLTDWDTPSTKSNEEPNDWKRVSKLRRSFQSATTATNSSHYKPTKVYAATPRRPVDLPENSVSVSRIREELEKGRPIIAAMRSDHSYPASLDNILHPPAAGMKPTPAKRSTFLTTESLKEIRGQLKKLSDETLYKDDFLSQHGAELPADVEHIEVQHVHTPKPDSRHLRQLTPDQSPQISPCPTAIDAIVKHTTNSLESKQKGRDTTTSEWHLRRKSYGFEKMSPPDNRSMFGMDASTDSGLGRSGELGNWSPTDTTPTTPARGTVIHFGDTKASTPTQTATKTAPPQPMKSLRRMKSPMNDDDDDESSKRHSIAVDESQYVRDNLRKISQVHINGFSQTTKDVAAKSVQPLAVEEFSSASGTSVFQRSQQKRVEFCKTEVHFAAESGRVNIVETDGKPPPTNNFRRRRRTTTGPLQSLVKSATAVSSRPPTSGGSSSSDSVSSSLMEVSSSAIEASNVTITIPKSLDLHGSGEGSRGSYAASTSGVETTDGEADEIAVIRGILKNKTIKPKPYHLGENIDSADALWGVQLKPVGGAETSDREKSASPESSAIKTVAERIRIVEKSQDMTNVIKTNGYSTKINLSLGGENDPQRRHDWKEPSWHNLTSPQRQPDHTQRRPSVQELMLKDLREHQRILDQGLKSTSLIIKTMRSANEFDDAMRRLSISSIEAATMPPIVVPTPMLRSNSYQEPSRHNASTMAENNRQIIKSASYTSTSSMASTTNARRLSTELYGSVVRHPLLPPRLNLLGRTEIPVSQQLTQLRRMYEADEDADSADEEVKSYFRDQYDPSDSGGGTQESSSLEDDPSVEYSGSWSRMKAKRTLWNVQAESERKTESTLRRAELPKSNVMSIELRSPQSSMEKPKSLTIMQPTPVAKTRILTTVQQNPPPHVQPVAATMHQMQMSQPPTSDSDTSSLRIVKEARGARKLREHELSYFGVQVDNSSRSIGASYDAKPKLLTNTNHNYTKRSLPKRRTQPLASDGNDNETNPLRDDDADEDDDGRREKQTTTTWKLMNDKPDLLRHSPIAVQPQITTRTAEIKPTERKSLRKFNEKFNNDNDNDDDDNAGDDEHFYENITNELRPTFRVKSPPVRAVNSYDRKMDLKRDEMILSEMTHNADQTLKALSDEAALKDQRRRSVQRHNSTPLETIDEKIKIRKAVVGERVARGTFASEARRNSRQSTPSPTGLGRTGHSSSQSSIESCPRTRCHSLSSEGEYENVKAPQKPKRSVSASVPGRHLKKPFNDHRSSSRDSQRSQLSATSTEDVRKRSRPKTKRSTTNSTTAQGTADKHHKSTSTSTTAPGRGDDRRHNHHHNRSTTTSSSTGHSTQRERTQCSQQTVASPSTRHSHQPIETATASSSGSARRRRDEQNLHKSSLSSSSLHKSATDKYREKSVHRSGGHHHNGSTERSVRSSQKSERLSEKDKEKSTSRSRGHSSRSHEPQSSKKREQKKSTITTTSAIKISGKVEPKHQGTVTTHSKNAQILNGSHLSHQTPQHNHHHHQNRYEHGKDRK